MNNQVMLLILLLVLVSSIVGAIVPSDGRLIFSWRQSHSEDSGVHNLEGVRSIYNRFLNAARSIRGGESHGKVIELVNIDMFNQILEDSANANKVMAIDLQLYCIIVLLLKYRLFSLYTVSSLCWTSRLHGVVLVEQLRLLTRCCQRVKSLEMHCT